MAFYGPRGGEGGGQTMAGPANVTPGANCANAWRIWKGLLEGLREAITGRVASS